MAESRFFWWSRKDLTYPWRPVLVGGDEYARRTVGVRVPGGMLFLALWRFPEFRGPCTRCGRWEHVDDWDGTHCLSCVAELGDWAAGCICPSILDDTPVDDWEFPRPGCPVHDHARST